MAETYFMAFLLTTPPDQGEGILYNYSYQPYKDDESIGKMH